MKFGRIVSELQRLAEWLVAEGCTHAVMESTGSYLKPVFNLLEAHVSVILANAARTCRTGAATRPIRTIAGGWLTSSVTA